MLKMVPVDKIEELIKLFEEHQESWESMMSNEDRISSAEEIEAESAVETYDFVICQLKNLIGKEE